MSKSLAIAIALAASPDEIRAAVRSMYTDPNHLHVEDPGTVEGTMSFAFLDAIEADTERVAELKAHYRRGGGMSLNWPARSTRLTISDAAWIVRR